MKAIKYNLILLLSILFASCNDWLDITQLGNETENTQFTTLEGTERVLNGFYREMISSNLYGAYLSQTAIEAMGNRFVYNDKGISTSENAATMIEELSNHKYTEANIESIFSAIWKSGYTLSFRINNYFKSIAEVNLPIDPDKKNILLGEAYAIRAYIHFDLFRIFGKTYELQKLQEERLPYNDLDFIDKTEDIVNKLYSLREESTEMFFKKLLRDIQTAESLLEKSDPILTNPGAVTEELVIDDFYMNRNRRMNYYAVLALKARVLQYMGNTEEAVSAVEKVLTAVGEGKPFQWHTALRGSDYTFFSEVIFGIHYLNMYTDGNSRYYGSKVLSGYFVSQQMLNNFMFAKPAGHDNPDVALGDFRRECWTENNGTDVGTGSNIFGEGDGVTKVFIQRRFKEPANSTTQSNAYHQPLIRLAEMFYIIAEAKVEAGLYDDAIAMFNEHLERRTVNEIYRFGHSNNPIDTNSPEIKSVLMDFIRKEYYCEFAGEGQLFFFNKRQQQDTFRDSNTANSILQIQDKEKAYVIDIPTIETNI